MGKVVLKSRRTISIMQHTPKLLYNALRLSALNRDISIKTKKHTIECISKLNDDEKLLLVDVIKEWYREEGEEYPYDELHVKINIDDIHVKLRWIISNFMKIIEQ